MRLKKRYTILFRLFDRQMMCELSLKFVGRLVWKQKLGMENNFSSVRRHVTSSSPCDQLYISQIHHITI